MYPIGIQLYTLKDECAKDIYSILKKVREIGFKGVELGGFYNMKPKELAGMIKDLGLEITSSHISRELLKSPDKIAEEQKTIGNSMVVTGFGADCFTSEDDCKKIAERLQKAQQLLYSSGIRLGYHNHYWEFREFSDRTCCEILFKTAKDIFFQLDTYWIKYGKHDPAHYISMMKDRIPLLHIKDGEINGAPDWTAVGEGVVDITSAIKAAEPNVLKWLIVEIDNYKGDMLDAVKKSYRFLVSTGLGQGNR